MSQLVAHANEALPADVAEERSVTIGPRVDVLETEHEFLVLADFPGVRPAEVEVRYEKGELVIHGRRPTTRENTPTNYHRVFAVADTVAADKISAELKAGVLTIHLPKVEAVKPKRIAVAG